MQRRTNKYLYDILQASNAILHFTSGKTLAIYQEDLLLRSAVERQFTIIGEAMNRLLHEEPSLIGQLPSAIAIISFRNRLVHGYDVIDDDIVWDVVEQDVPALVTQVEYLLRA